MNLNPLVYVCIYVESTDCRQLNIIIARLCIQEGANEKQGKLIMLIERAVSFFLNADNDSISGWLLHIETYKNSFD